MAVALSVKSGNHFANLFSHPSNIGTGKLLGVCYTDMITPKPQKLHEIARLDATKNFFFVS